MSEYYSSQSPLSPRRWFVGDDDHIRPFWRAMIFLLLGFFVVLLMSGPLHRYGEGVKRGGWTAGLLLLTWMMLSTFDRRSFRTAGLWFYSGWWKELLLGLAIGVALISSVFGGLLLTGAAQVEQVAGGQTNLAGPLVGLAFLLFTAALAEEVLYRGYPFQRFIESFGPRGAVLVFSFLFGVGHLGNRGATPLSTANTVLAGVILAQAYLKTRGLWLPFGLHWSWNFFLGPVFGLPISGFRMETSLMRTKVSGQEWLTGGNYGPEGSIVLTIVCVAAVVALWKAPWITPSPAMQDVLK